MTWTHWSYEDDWSAIQGWRDVDSDALEAYTRSVFKARGMNYDVEPSYWDDDEGWHNLENECAESFVPPASMFNINERNPYIMSISRVSPEDALEDFIDGDELKEMVGKEADLQGGLYVNRANMKATLLKNISEIPKGKSSAPIDPVLAEVMKENSHCFSPRELGLEGYSRRGDRIVRQTKKQSKGRDYANHIDWAKLVQCVNEVTRIKHQLTVEPVFRWEGENDRMLMIATMRKLVTNKEFEKEANELLADYKGIDNVKKLWKGVYTEVRTANE